MCVFTRTGCAAARFVHGFTAWLETKRFSQPHGTSMLMRSNVVIVSVSVYAKSADAVPIANRVPNTKNKYFFITLPFVFLTHSLSLVDENYTRHIPNFQKKE